MEVHLIRHTTPAVPPDTCYGQTDVLLDANYSSEIERTTKLLNTDLDTIYTSPMSRCQLLASKLSASPTVDHRLMELNFGDWEMRPWKEIPQTQLDSWMTDFVNISPPNGESFIDLHERVFSFLSELHAQEHQKVAIITHAGVIRSIISTALGLPLNNAFRLSVDYGSLSSYTYIKGHYQLNTLNKT